MAAIVPSPSHRARGCLWGVALGDALGTTLEFRVPAPGSPPHDRIIGGGPFDVLPGQVTDDTQMTIALAGSIRDAGGWDREAATAAYVAWLEDRPFDIGTQTSRSLRRHAAGVGPDAAWADWSERADPADTAAAPAGNGSLMRIAPIATWGAERDPSERRAAAAEDAWITHPDPRCVMAAVLWTDILAGIIAGDVDAAVDREMVHGSAVWATTWMYASAHGPVAAVRDGVDAILAAWDAAVAGDSHGGVDPAVAVGSCMGRVDVAIAGGVHALVHGGTDPWSTLVAVVGRGGDADTVGAIAGAGLGALHGLGAWPSDAMALVRDCAPDAPWNDRWHPRRLDPPPGYRLTERLARATGRFVRRAGVRG